MTFLKNSFSFYKKEFVYDNMNLNVIKNYYFDKHLVVVTEKS